MRTLMKTTKAKWRISCVYALGIFSRIGGIVQGDYIGVSGGTRYTPNTLEYIFSTPTTEHIVFAPHTNYTEISPTAVPTFGCVLSGETGTHMVGSNEA